jgi:hypothetical protein
MGQKQHIFSNHEWKDSFAMAYLQVQDPSHS